ncbi:MAG: GNAT family N-acetyltransferase [Eubacteriales bacterium]|nr:GNAT family N-acetyltransferase [Eubacteriales bacterium]
MISFREVSYLEFQILFLDLRSRFVDLIAREAQLTQGSLHVLFAEHLPAGFCLVTDEREYRNIRFLFVREEFRRKGYAGMLLRNELREKKGTKEWKFSIQEESEWYDCLKKLVEQEGFMIKDKVHLFTCVRDDFIHWNEYMDRKGKRLAAWLEQQGFVTISFRECGEEWLEKLRRSEGNEYGNQLHVRGFLEGKRTPVSDTMSFLCVRGDEIAAYSLVSKVDKSSVVFEQISTCQKMISQGTVLLPFAKTMEQFWNEGCRRGVYAMYEGNLPALAFADKILKQVTVKEKLQYNFIKAAE